MVDRARAAESVAERFTRSMDAATSRWGVLTDLSLAFAVSAVPLVLLVHQIGGGETRSATTMVLVGLAVLPVLGSLALSLSLRGAREQVIGWIASVPFPVENVNALLVGLTDTFEITFADAASAPARMELQRRLDPISDDVLVTTDPKDGVLEVKIGVIESKRLPLASAYARWARFRRIVDEVLVPLHRERAIDNLRVN